MIIAESVPAGSTKCIVAPRHLPPQRNFVKISFGQLAPIDTESKPRNDNLDRAGIRFSGIARRGHTANPMTILSRCGRWYLEMSRKMSKLNDGKNCASTGQSCGAS